MTYQRNMFERGAFLFVLEDGFDERLPERVEQAEIAACDHDEAEDDRGRLAHLLAVRPLHATELVHAVPEEDDEPRAAAALALVLDGHGAGAAPDGRVALDLVG